MTTINVHEAKTHLSRLLVQVEKGEEVFIARAGKVIAKLSPMTAVQGTGPGEWKGLVTMSPDFDKEDPALVALFESGGDSPL